MKIKKTWRGGGRGDGAGVRWGGAVLLNPPVIYNTIAMRSVDSD